MNELLDDELLDLLTAAIDGLRSRCYCVKLNDQAMHDRYKSIEFLTDALCLYEKQFPMGRVNHPKMESLEFDFLRSILEKNAPLFYAENQIFEKLGFKRDRSGISLPQKKEIAVQATAQALWFVLRAKIPKIEKMKKKILDRDEPYYDLLEFDLIPKN